MTRATSTRPTGRTHATLRALMRLRGLPTRRDEIFVVPACLNQQPGDASVPDWFLDTDALRMLLCAKNDQRYTGTMPTCEACQALVDVALENPVKVPHWALRWSGWVDFSRSWGQVEDTTSLYRRGLLGDDGEVARMLYAQRAATHNP